MKIIQAKKVTNVEALQWSGRNIKQFKDLFKSMGFEFDYIAEDNTIFFKINDEESNCLFKGEYFVFWFNEFEESHYEIVSAVDFNSDYEVE